MLTRFKILLYGDIVWFFAEGLLGPLFAVFASRVGGNVLEITQAWALYLAVTGFITIQVGKLSDEKISKEKLMLTGYALKTIFMFSYLIVGNSFQLLLVQVGLGIASAFATPTWEALYARSQRKDETGYDWGLATGEAQMVTGLATLLGGLIVSYGSFAWLFVAMGTMQLIATLFQAQLIWKKRH